MARVPGLERLAKLLNQRELIDGLLVHGGRKEREAALAEALRLVESDVGVLEELRATAHRRVGHHDADAGSLLDGDSANIERRGQSVEESRRDRRGFVDRGQTFGQVQELITPETAQGVRVARDLL
jgi:hypothetical protein